MNYVRGKEIPGRPSRPNSSQGRPLARRTPVEPGDMRTWWAVRRRTPMVGMEVREVELVLCFYSDVLSVGYEVSRARCDSSVDTVRAAIGTSLGERP